MRAHGAHEQRVAVRRSACGHGAANVAARARAVVHHHGLTELLRQILRDHARQNVGGAARRERHDDGDRLAGIVVVG
ncbi:hypothetical protein SDC9_119524 [bioreactor metagenome]|uniref:Uncharacterized protein n=1 Tax=bioreactor metagenome TaxID=1076179 RepID=A0A645C5A5_9ZZZZ